MLRTQGVCAGAVAFAAALAACSHSAPRAEPALTAANAKKAYAVGQRLAMEDRERDRAHRLEMARLIGTRIAQTREADASMSLLLAIDNKSPKAIRALDAGLRVYNAAGKRIGMTEVHVPHPVPARATVTFWYAVPYARFGEDAGTLRMAAGKRKTIRIETEEIRYRDGTDAGYDD